MTENKRSFLLCDEHSNILKIQTRVKVWQSVRYGRVKHARRMQYKEFYFSDFVYTHLRVLAWLMIDLCLIQLKGKDWMTVCGVIRW